MSRHSVNSKILLPFRFPGGKYYALRKLRPFWESQKHDEYREPFLGGGAVFWAKPKATINWLNDIDSSLILTLEFIKDSIKREELLKLFEDESPKTLLLNPRFIVFTVVGTLIIALVSALAPIGAQVIAVGAFISMVAGLNAAYLDKQLDREMKEAALRKFILLGGKVAGMD